MLSVVICHFKVNTFIMKNTLWKISHPWKLMMNLIQSKERFVCGVVGGGVVITY